MIVAVHEFFLHASLIISIAFVLDIYFAERPFDTQEATYAWLRQRLRFLFQRHPVCYIGILYNFFEFLGRKFDVHSGNVTKVCMRLVSCLSLMSIVAISGGCVWILTHIFTVITEIGLVAYVGKYSEWDRGIVSTVGICVGYFFTIYFAYTGLATGCLLQIFSQVLQKVEHAPLEEAQQALGQLVSRDTSVLDRQMLRKSLADTMSENITDAVVAPLFWLYFTGPVGLWMYKAVSTGDSMWGYKTPKWLHLGFAPAKADDALAYIPARLAVFFMWLAFIFMRMMRTRKCCTILGNMCLPHNGHWPGFATIAAQAKGMESPNSGWPMAAAGWILGTRLGGPTQYFGKMVEKPWVGATQEYAVPWDAQRLELLSQLVRITAIISYVCMLICSAIFLVVLSLIL